MLRTKSGKRWLKLTVLELSYLKVPFLGVSRLLELLQILMLSLAHIVSANSATQITAEDTLFGFPPKSPKPTEQKNIHMDSQNLRLWHCCGYNSI